MTKIRRMVEADLPAVAQLAAELVRLHHAWDPRRFFHDADTEVGYRGWLGAQLGEPTAVLLVAEVEGALVGYFCGGLEGRDWARLLDAHGAIHDVHVDAKQRRRGIARALMTEGIAALAELGAQSVVLSSATSNAEAQTLFESLGFRRTMVEMTRPCAPDP